MYHLATKHSVTDRQTDRQHYNANIPKIGPYLPRLWPKNKIGTFFMAPDVILKYLKVIHLLCYTAN